VALLAGSLVGILRTVPDRRLVFPGQRLDRVVPQHPAAGADLPLVPRGAGHRAGLQGFPSFMLVVLALGFFTSRTHFRAGRAGIQSLPRGQRHAGLAMGLTLPQTYRYVLLPMAFRIVIPPLTSESMNIIKNSSVAFAVSMAELTMFAMQAGEETSRPVEMYLAVTALYFVSAFAINRVAL
jgi:glutamate/aspartate transport system permease protein